jgi:hypothetical protein
MRTNANKSAAGKRGIPSLFHGGRPWPAPPERFRSPVKNEIEMHGRTLRMSLVLFAFGRWTIAHLCTGRRAYSARNGGQHAPRPLVGTQYGLPRAPRCEGEPGGWSRPDRRLACSRKSLYPAAHPQR